MDQNPRSFIPGLALSEAFFREVVQPFLAQSHPGLRYAAGLLGEGSEVLGYDDETSTDHCWGPRVILFLGNEDADLRPGVLEALWDQVPLEFMGHRTDLECAHKSAVDVYTVTGYVRRTFGFDLPDGGDRSAVLAWLSMPSQRLLEFTSGRVFRDDVGLNALRERAAYYPHDVWLYLMACQWARIGQEEPFVGRCGSVGDELGSQVVAGRLVRDMMNLGFLMSRRYTPYSKWFGTAFGRIPCGPVLGPVLRQALAATGWKEREALLNVAYQTLARMHNELALTEPIAEEVSGFHDRPFLVIHGQRFAEALHHAIKDPDVQLLPLGVGSIDQFVDNTDVLSDASRASKVRTWMDTMDQTK